MKPIIAALVLIAAYASPAKSESVESIIGGLDDYQLSRLEAAYKVHYHLFGGYDERCFSSRNSIKVSAEEILKPLERPAPPHGGQALTVEASLSILDAGAHCVGALNMKLETQEPARTVWSKDPDGEPWVVWGTSTLHQEMIAMSFEPGEFEQQLRTAVLEFVSTARLIVQIARP